jgi:hypothetical protein
LRADFHKPNGDGESRQAPFCASHDGLRSGRDTDLRDSEF